MYPIMMHIYNQSVGKLLPHRISQILKELGYREDSGYKIWINPRQGNGVDFKILFNGSLIIVGEVLNWSIGSQLSDKRYRSIMDNFSKYSCHKVLIHTVLEKDKVERFERNGIITIEIGYQILPRYFYNFFKQKGQIVKRKIDSKHTRDDIKNKIECLVNNLHKSNQLPMGNHCQF